MLMMLALPFAELDSIELLSLVFLGMVEWMMGTIIGDYMRT